MKKISPQQLKKLAKYNPYVDLNFIRQWERQDDELRRLGVDFSHPNRQADAPDETPKNRQPLDPYSWNFPNRDR